ncbi:MAG: hypothetical protein ACD_12C00889G0002 [uncultured bacterium]|nr:MAG: hypothetical protein ACD_12C00889G0002 [uncultured bacterium]
MSNLLRLYLSHKLTEKKSIFDPEKLNTTIRSANIDLNPHQIDAAIFAFKSPLSRGAILADEVGLGKTIEAGLIINQLWVEGRNHILILVPASLRSQWQDELTDRFNLESRILDGPSLKKLQKEKSMTNPLKLEGIYITSHNFSYKYDVYCKEISWDLVVIDEAHRMRNVYRKGNKTAKKIKEVIKGYPKLLLTATPLQNNLMELYGLTSFLEDGYLGTEYSFRTLFVNPIKRQKRYDNLPQLRNRLMGTLDPSTGEYHGGILTRTLRKQVKGFVQFTNRFCITEDFAPNDNEMNLYNLVSDYLRRPYLASTKATQRNMMELIYRKILASSTFAISGTLKNVANFIAKRLQKEFKITHLEIIETAENIKSDLEKQWKKQLPVITLDKIEESKDLFEETLPGFDDIEANSDKLQEENEDTDDLGEDKLFADSSKKIEQKEIEHKFSKEEVLAEFKDVINYFFLASSISVNQKSQALVRSLKRLFEHAQKKEWPQKAVIFTESRRTQDHLEKLLSGIGYDLILFNGSNASEKAKKIYEEWANEFPKEAEKGSKSINIRKALIWKFKQINQGILITTEAGAEGLNLQFSNIVINYDLPWNPQRVEQRIGRCHRYGQELDVLVVNFLNKRNYADQRVYELLKEKIMLFGNLFNFSDKVLGTEQLTSDGYEVREVALGGLGTGVDFERKILDIYRKCRTENQIKKEFDQLQLDLGDVIIEKVEETHKKVIQHFDEEVRQKLQIRKQKLTDSLSKLDTYLKRYSNIVFKSKIKQVSDSIFEIDNDKYSIGNITKKERDEGIKSFHTSLPIIQSIIKQDRNIVGKWKLNFIHPKEKARKSFEEYIHKDGQLIIDILISKRKTINNTEEIFENMIVSMLIKEGVTWKKIETKRGEKILELEIENERPSLNRLRDELLDITNENLQHQKELIIKQNEDYVFQEEDHLNKFIEESLLKFKNEIENREKELKELNKQLRNSKTLGYYERQQVQDEIAKKQKELFKTQKKYFQAQESQFTEKDKRVFDLRNKLQLNFETKRLAEVEFTIVD